MASSLQQVSWQTTFTVKTVAKSDVGVRPNVARSTLHTYQALSLPSQTEKICLRLSSNKFENTLLYCSDLLIYLRFLWRFLRAKSDSGKIFLLFDSEVTACELSEGSSARAAACGVTRPSSGIVGSTRCTAQVTGKDRKKRDSGTARQQSIHQRLQNNTEKTRWRDTGTQRAQGKV